jgi:hypothetical protein
MKHEYLLNDVIAKKVLGALTQLSEVMGGNTSMAAIPAAYVTTENEKLAAIIDNLVDNQQAWKLNLVAPEMTVSLETAPLPAPGDERVIRIPMEPADPVVHDDQSSE